MSNKRLNVIDNIALSQLLEQKHERKGSGPSHGEWVRIIRTYLRMTQIELAKRAKIAQSHLVSIERGEIDPQVSTLQRIFSAMSCELAIWPEPLKALDDVLRGRARSVALKRLKQSMGTMALEKQQPDRELFLQLLEQRTTEILEDKRGRLHVGDDA